MAKQTTTGITLGIAEGEPATLDAAGFEAMSYTEIGQLTNVPEFGPTISVVESTPLKTAIVEKFVGSVNYGSQTLEADFDDEDAGQDLVTDAVTVGSASFGKQFSIELTYASGAKRYYLGRFFSATENPGTVDSMVGLSMNLEINSQVLKVAPTP